MTPIAIIFLVLSATILWGGLAWSLLRLRSHPDIPEDGPTDIPAHQPDT